MKIIEKLKKMFVSFEDMIATEHACLSCDKEILDGSAFQLCDKCLTELKKIDGRVCLKCGEKLEGDKLKCDFCDDFDYAFDSNRSIFYYDEVSSKIVKSLKYGGRKYYAKHIAKMMTADRYVFDNVDIITYVPISSKRKRTRGFNQAEEIAREISNLINIPVFELLDKVIDKKNQAKLSQKDRLENLKGTFALNKDFEDKIKAKRILIVDDVFTTGATLSECASVIKHASPKGVKTLTFAKTKLNSIN